MQLETVADAPSQTGAAARAVVDLVRPHMEVEERMVLQFLEFTEAVASGQTPTDAQILAMLQSLTAELPPLMDADMLFRPTSLR